MFQVFLFLISLLCVVVIVANSEKSSLLEFEAQEMHNSNERLNLALDKVFEIDSLDFIQPGRDHFVTTISTAAPSEAPSEMPSVNPSAVPSIMPTVSPSAMLTVSSSSAVPSRSPSAAPTSSSPSLTPSLAFGQIYSPTVAPSATPTLLIATVVKYAVAQTVKHINSTQFKAHYEANKHAFEETVASSTVGITASDVNVTGVTDVDTTTRRRLQSSSTVATSCMIDYDITIPASTVATYSSPEAAYNATKTALTSSVSSGAFTATLQSVASAAGLTTLAKANSTVVTQSTAVVLVTVNTASPSTAPTSTANTNNHKEHRLHGGDIAAIVICSIVFVAVVMSVIYYLMWQRRAVSVSPVLPIFHEQQLQQQQQLASQYPEQQSVVQYEQQQPYRQYQPAVMVDGADTAPAAAPAAKLTTYAEAVVQA